MDYNRQATIRWLNRPYWDDPRAAPMEEFFDDFSLKEAVLFAVCELDTARCKSVTIRCEGEEYALPAIEAIYHNVDFPRA